MSIAATYRPETLVAHADGGIDDDSDVAAECALTLQACQRRGFGDRLLIIQQSLKMQQDGFLRVAEGLFQRIARREAAGKIRDRHSVGVPLVADLNGNGIPHIESSQNARLLAKSVVARRYQAASRTCGSSPARAASVNSMSRLKSFH